MTKPLGIDQLMRVIKPTPAEDAIWAAVRAARGAGWTVEQFRLEAAEAWAQDQRDQQKHDAESWGRRHGGGP